MTARQERIAQFRDDMAHLLSVVTALPAERRQASLDGGWTAQDVLAHIAAWDRELVRAVDEVLAEERPSFITYDVDAFNARAVAAMRERPWEATVAELRQAHDRLLAWMADVSDADWERPSAYTWPDGTPITTASLFTYSYQGETHYRGHARELAAAAS